LSNCPKIAPVSAQVSVSDWTVVQNFNCWLLSSLSVCGAWASSKSWT